MEDIKEPMLADSSTEPQFVKEDIPKNLSKNPSQDDDKSTSPSPSSTERLSRIETLKEGIRISLTQGNKKRTDIEIEHFPGFKPYERYQCRIERNNEFERSSQGSIIYVSKRKLIEKLTHDYQQNSEISRVVLYTYRWYLDEKQMFTLLLERFKTPIPLALSPNEKKSFLESVVSKIQIKVLIFLKDWFKCYAHKLHTDTKLEEMFFELLFLMFTHPDTGKWINLPISQLLSDLENLPLKRETNNIRNILKVTSLPEIFVPLPIILSYSHLLAKQLCILDIENLKRIKVTEFYKKAWTKSDIRWEEAPNLAVIAEMSTKLSRLTTYLILMNKKNMIRVILYQYLIDLCDQLVRLRNYNSAFAIYLGLTSPALNRLNSVLESNLEKEPKEVFAGLKDLFSSTNNMQTLRTKQNEAMTPAVPHLGLYLTDLVYLDELSDYKDSQNVMLGFPKFAQISDKINKLLSFRESYGFHKVDNILNFIKGIPIISEDRIYELCEQVSV